MLRLSIGKEFFNEETNEFYVEEDFVIDLEHSLVSLSKWESEFQKPFLGTKEKTSEEIFGYLRAMVLTEGVDAKTLDLCLLESVDKIQAYIDSKQTATTFGRLPERRGPGEIITSELIYYWMVQFNIPWEAEKWHLNRLFSLIQICNIKNQPPKKMSRHEIAMRNRELNAQRKAALGTKG